MDSNTQLLTPEHDTDENGNRVEIQYRDREVEIIKEVEKPVYHELIKEVPVFKETKIIEKDVNGFVQEINSLRDLGITLKKTLDELKSEKNVAAVTSTRIFEKVESFNQSLLLQAATVQALLKKFESVQKEYEKTRNLIDQDLEKFVDKIVASQPKQDTSLKDEFSKIPVMLSDMKMALQSEMSVSHANVFNLQKNFNDLGKGMDVVVAESRNLGTKSDQERQDRSITYQKFVTEVQNLITKMHVSLEKILRGFEGEQITAAQIQKSIEPVVGAIPVTVHKNTSELFARYKKEIVEEVYQAIVANREHDKKIVGALGDHLGQRLEAILSKQDDYLAIMARVDDYILKLSNKVMEKRGEFENHVEGIHNSLIKGMYEEFDKLQGRVTRDLEFTIRAVKDYLNAAQAQTKTDPVILEHEFYSDLPPALAMAPRTEAIVMYKKRWWHFNKQGKFIAVKGTWVRI